MTMRITRHHIYTAAAVLLMLCAVRSDAAVLTVDDCLALAELNHPSLVSAAASVSGDIARLKSAAAGDRVTVNGSVSTSRSGGGDKGETSSFSAGASAGLRIYDAGRSRYRIDAQRDALASTREKAEQTRRDVRTAVKTAYTNLLLNQETAAAREAAVRAYEEHLVQARGYYEAGSRPWYDVTKAEVDLGNARLELTNARSNVTVARATLLSSMGLTGEAGSDIELADIEVVPVSWDIVSRGPDAGHDGAPPIGDEVACIDTALEHRSDYIASEWSLASSRASLAAALREGSPSISLNAGYSGSGSHIGNLGKGWNGGLTMSIPIVDGGASAAAADIASASLASAEASHDALRQKIVLEVRTALNSLNTAYERRSISELTVANAQENYRLAAGRYETGVGDALEVADALVALTNAYLSQHQSRNAVEAAVIKLESVLGVELAR